MDGKPDVKVFNWPKMFVTRGKLEIITLGLAKSDALDAPSIVTRVLVALVSSSTSLSVLRVVGSPRLSQVVLMVEVMLTGVSVSRSWTPAVSISRMFPFVSTIIQRGVPFKLILKIPLVKLSAKFQMNHL